MQAVYKCKNVIRERDLAIAPVDLPERPYWVLPLFAKGVFPSSREHGRRKIFQHPKEWTRNKKIPDTRSIFF